MAIDVPDFVVNHSLRALGLQGDWGVKRVEGTEGGRFVVDNTAKAHEGCLHFLARVSTSTADLALIPELAIPRQTVVQIIETLRTFPRPVVFIGGVEGLTRDEYDALLTGTGGVTQPLVEGSTNGYINTLLLIVNSQSAFHVHLRAKRVPSRAESLHGPPMAQGLGPFVTVRLGLAQLTLVPLICSEFVWPELWQRLDEETPGNIDIVPVLQHNDDKDARHLGPQLHQAYTRGAKTANTRFILVNQAVGPECDGACYVVVPPTTPSAPQFDHSLNELWHLPGPRTYKGFRIPDKTGCIWSTNVVSAQAATSALAERVCRGGVLEVLTPPATELHGLSAGLMRSAAAMRTTQWKDKIPSADVRESLMGSLDRTSSGYMLRDLTTSRANEVVFRMKCAEWPQWAAIEQTIDDFVEAAALLTAGGEQANVIPSPAGNVSIAGKSVLILYSPNVDSAFSARFPPASMLEGSAIPEAIVLTGVISGTNAVGARKVGDILRADRVTSTSDELADVPRRAEDSSVTIRIDDVEFLSVVDLRPNLTQPSMLAARQRLGRLFPKVYQ